MLKQFNIFALKLAWQCITTYTHGNTKIRVWIVNMLGKKGQLREGRSLNALCPAQEK
jgi:hypothetical protein